MGRGGYLLVLVCACGRISFDGAGADAEIDVFHPPDPSVTAFCATAVGTIPSDAVASLCFDFESTPTGHVDDMAFFVPDTLFARSSSGFATDAVITSGDTRLNKVFAYQPLAGSTCPPDQDGHFCCYGDMFIDVSDRVFTDHVHIEYEHYMAVLPDPAIWIGSLFWGGRREPYTLDLVTPALVENAWQHVVIDGDVGLGEPLTISVNGVTRANTGGTANHNAGVQTSIGTFCWGDEATGYVDNVLFWGR